MNFDELSDDEWMLVSSLVSDEPPIRLNRRGRPRAEPRVVANAVLWILTTGESWSRLPARYPSGPTCRRRFEEWHVTGTLGELVALLAQRGRNFVYVPEPVPAQPVVQEAQAVQAVAVAVEEAVEDDGLPAVYWKSPEAWQAPASIAETPLANPIESMTRQLARLDEAITSAQTHTTTRSQQARAAQPAPTRPRVPGAGLVPPQADSSATATRVNMPLAQSAVRTANQAAMPVEARFEEGLDVDAGPLWTNAIVEATQIVEWDGYAMHLSVETSRNNMYRAAVEILKDGKRLERSGLIGPPFEDADSARNFAFDWARQWVEREGEIEPEAATSAAEPGSSVASEAASEAGAQTTALSTTRSTNGVITRSAAGSVRLAPMQRFTASTPLRASVDPCDSSAERRVHVSRYRTHLG
ncbi:transposase [Paraburkholderia tropica]|uniref:transposase n=1 Tax=Paraburkholderia tropica TaxID=92647 RepID=UPI002AB715A0|nr:transposase [Paraburkholderia tropica]